MLRARIGEAFGIAALLALALGAGAGPAALAASDDDVEFRAEIDRTQVSIDDSVSLKLITESNGRIRLGDPSFEAPDFEVVNEYSGSFVNSTYDASTQRFSVRSNQSVTKVLRPMKQGTLTIRKIELVVGGKTLKAPDITVQVVGTGAGTPQPKGYSGIGGGLRGQARKSTGADVLLRAEIDRDEVFKGEQIVVSYYLYRKVRTFNITVDKFPTLNGFLREDLEIPVMGQGRLDNERVMLNGVPYERSLLVRYAAYPLQEGKLKIDSLSMKYNYYANARGPMQDEDDPFLNFFQQMTPRGAQTHSEPITIEVKPLPEAGRPGGFSGGVGDFQVVAALDRYEVHANEAVTLTVKIEGRGNVGAVTEPKAAWPSGIELYDTKGRSKSGKGGVGEKVFEFLLIPRTPGEVTLPKLDFYFFDPAKKIYYTRSTDAIQIKVGEPLPGTALIQPGTRPAPGATAAPAAGGKQGEEPRGLWASADRAGASVFQRLLEWIWGLGLAVGLIVGGRVVVAEVRRRITGFQASQAPKRRKEQVWQELKQLAQTASADSGVGWDQVSKAYDRLMDQVLDALRERVPGGARSLPRHELRAILVGEQGLAEEHWDRLERLMEFSETVRFAVGGGGATETQARQELARWVGEAEGLTRVFSGSRGKDTGNPAAAPRRTRESI